jgi:hypothetical protein
MVRHVYMLALKNLLCLICVTGRSNQALGVGAHVGEPTSPFSDWRLQSCAYKGHIQFVERRTAPVPVRAST